MTKTVWSQRWEVLVEDGFTMRQADIVYHMLDECRAFGSERIASSAWRDLLAAYMPGFRGEDMWTDAQAIDVIHAAMDGAEWDADLWDVVADAIRRTGRPAFRSPDDDIESVRGGV